MGPVIRRLAPTRTAVTQASAGCAVQGAEIHWVEAGRPAADVIAGAPSIHMVWGGAQPLYVDNRALRLDEETFLVLNAGHVLSTRGRRDPAAAILSVYFDPAQFAAALKDLPAQQRELIAPWLHAGVHSFFEHLRERDKAIDAVMRYLAHHVCAGVDEPQWYEEQVGFLLRRLLANEAAIAQAVSAMTRTKPHRRRDTFARLARVADLIHSAYERQLTMDELAEAAHWSVFHMMREFKAAHGVSPYEYLQRRRTAAAVRLLCTTDLSVAEIADRVGFHERSTLMRRLRRIHGLNARAMRLVASSQSPQALPHRMTSPAAPGGNSTTTLSQVR